MVLSSRDRRYVVVEMVWLGPSLERRRLRFSFQFNDVKDLLAVNRQFRTFGRKFQIPAPRGQAALQDVRKRHRSGQRAD